MVYLDATNIFVVSGQIKIKCIYLFSFETKSTSVQLKTDLYSSAHSGINFFLIYREVRIIIILLIEMIFYISLLIIIDLSR